jgi:prepilin-type N-terminal cleavage/methylation domain-containing protein
VPRTLLQRLRSNRGWTLVELLVTIVILTMLAAIALPAYTGHQKKSKDSEAQSNARNLTSRIELCFATSESYLNCDTDDELKADGAGTGLAWGTGAGEVAVVDSDQKTYTVVAVSKSATDDSNHTFTIDRTATGVAERSCTAGSTNDHGSCRDGRW